VRMLQCIYTTRTQRNFFVGFCLRSMVFLVRTPPEFHIIIYVWRVVHGEKLYRLCPWERKSSAAAAGSPKIMRFVVPAAIPAIVCVCVCVCVCQCKIDTTIPSEYIQCISVEWFLKHLSYFLSTSKLTTI